MYKQREKELQEWKIKKAEEDDKAKQAEESKKQKLEETRKKKREHFLKNVKLTIHNKSAKKHELKVYEVIKKEEDLKKAEEVKASKKKMLEKILEVDKKKIEKKKKVEDELIQKKTNPKVVEFFETMKNSISQIFSHYCKSVTNKDGTVPSALSFQGFTKFCTSFNIVPGLVSNDKSLMVFRTTTKSKQEKSANASSLTESDFMEALLRFSHICKEELAKDLNIQFESEEDSLKGLFEYLSISSDSKQTRDLLKRIDFKNKNVHPRDKKRMKNQMNQSITREISASNRNSKKKLPKISKDSKGSILKVPDNVSVNSEDL